MSPEQGDTIRLVGEEASRLFADRYRIGTELGSGGMATVYRGYDTLLHRDVAVKVLSGRHSSDPLSLSRFSREARYLAGIKDPGLVTVHDVGVEAGNAFMVMELLEGRTVREVIRDEGRLSPKRAAEVCAAVCQALAVCHDRGVIHRDIKPSNVFITSSGSVRLLDFGIACDSDDPARTQTSVVVGTAAYISPEQVRGRRATAQSDLYAVGCMLFEMLTGRPPFVAETPVGLIYRHAHEKPQRPSSLVPGIPPQLDALVVQLLAKDPNDRPGSIEAILAILNGSAVEDTTTVYDTTAQLLTRTAEMPPLAHEPKRPRRRARVLTGAAAAVIALALVFSLFTSLTSHAGSPSPGASTGAAQSTSATPSTDPTPSATATTSGPSTAAPTPPSGPTLPTATTPDGALSALLYVTQAGAAAGLIDPTANASLVQAIGSVQDAMSRGNGHRVGARVNDLAATVDQLTAAGDITGPAAAVLQQGIAQLQAVL